MVVSYRLYGSENQYVCSEILLHTHTNIYIYQSYTYEFSTILLPKWMWDISEDLTLR